MGGTPGGFATGVVTADIVVLPTPFEDSGRATRLAKVDFASAEFFYFCGEALFLEFASALGGKSLGGSGLAMFLNFASGVRRNPLWVGRNST